MIVKRAIGSAIRRTGGLVGQAWGESWRGAARRSRLADHGSCRTERCRGADACLYKPDAAAPALRANTPERAVEAGRTAQGVAWVWSSDGLMLCKLNSRRRAMQGA